jgi:AbrB family looped-hinge helix DNA binding protein
MQVEQRVYPVKVDASGGITLPREIRERHHIAAGDTLLLVDDANGLHLRKLETGATDDSG